MSLITFNGHPVQILRVWASRNVTGEPLLTVRSLETHAKWEVWGFELKGDYNVIKESIEEIERYAM